MQMPGDGTRVGKPNNLLQMVALKKLDIVAAALEQGEGLTETAVNGYTPLMFAVRNDDIAMVNLLLRYNAEVDAVTDYGQTALIEAVTRRNVEVTAALLDKGTNPDLKNTFGMNALLIVCSTPTKNRSAEIATLLLNKNANPDIESNIGYTPIMYSAMEGSEVMVKILLQYGASRSGRNGMLTAKILAKSMGHEEIIRLL